MRVLISGGGTGGHVYPALAVAELLTQDPTAANEPVTQPTVPDPHTAAANKTKSHSRHAVVWVGSTGGMEEDLVRRAGIRFRSIDTGQLRGKNPLTAARNAGRMLNGVRQSRGLLFELEPDVCLVTGGYVCAPVVVACRQQGVPVLIYLPDMAPGSAIRWLSRLAQRLAVSLPDAAAYFGGLISNGGKAVVTGYPVRPELLTASQDREEARRRLAEALDRPSLAPGSAHAPSPNNGDLGLPLLLVWGGSQGSRSINQATWDALPHLLRRAHVVHIVGVRDWEMAQPILQAQRNAPEWQPEWSDRYHPVAYLHEAMPWALAAADLSVARAGASILGEFPVAGLPSVLVPLPIAGVGQELNARALAGHGAAVILDDDKLDDDLAATVTALLTDRPRLQEMEASARRLAQPEAAHNIITELIDLASQGGMARSVEAPEFSIDRTDTRTGLHRPD